MNVNTLDWIVELRIKKFQIWAWENDKWNESPIGEGWVSEAIYDLRNPLPFKLAFGGVS